VTLDNPAGFTQAVNAFLAKHKTRSCFEPPINADERR